MKRILAHFLALAAAWVLAAAPAHAGLALHGQVLSTFSQEISFGALDPAGSGGVPMTGPLTGTTSLSGLFASDFQISGGVMTPTGTGAPNCHPFCLFLTNTGVLLSVTEDALTYDVLTQADWDGATGVFANHSPSPFNVGMWNGVNLNAAQAALVSATNPTNGKTATIGSHTYTFNTTLVNSDCSVLIGANITASMANLTAAINLGAGSGTAYSGACTANTDVSSTTYFVAPGTIINNQTVTLGAHTYTFKSVLVSGDCNVLIGSSNTTANNNLTAAMALGAGSGTLYSSACTAADFSQTLTGATSAVRVTALSGGSAGNAISVASTLTPTSTQPASVGKPWQWIDDSNGVYGVYGETNLTNGIDAVAATTSFTMFGQPADSQTVRIGSTYTFQTTLTNVAGHVQIGASTAASLTNLIAAINNSAPGTGAYAPLTVANTVVTAAQGSGLSMNLTAITAGTAANSTTISTTMFGSGAAVAKLGGSVLAGKIIALRPGISIYQNNVFDKTAFLQTLTVQSRDLTNPATFLDTIQHWNWPNMTLRGIVFAPQSNTNIIVFDSQAASPVHNITLDQNTFQGPTFDAIANATALANNGKNAWPALSGIITTSAAQYREAFITITSNKFLNLRNGVINFDVGSLNISGNLFDNFYTEATSPSYPSPATTDTSGNFATCPCTPFNPPLIFNDNVFTRSQAFHTDWSNPHSDDTKITGVGGQNTDWQMTVDRNRTYPGLARGEPRFLAEEGMPAGVYATGEIIGNMGILQGVNAGINFDQAKNLTVLNNTMTYPFNLGTGNNTSPVTIHIGAVTNGGGNVVSQNAAELITAVGATLTQNVTLASGPVPSYADYDFTQYFAGSTWIPATLNGMMSTYTLKPGGCLDAVNGGTGTSGPGGSCSITSGAAFGVGAVGSGKVTYPTTVPGNNGVNH